MARKIPHNFLESGEQAIATYNFIDIIEASGIIEFYGFRTIDDATQNSLLTANDSIYSQGTNTAVGTSGGGFTKDIDIDFDLTFNRTQTIKGNGYCNIVTFVSSNYAGTQQYFIIKLRKFDGSTETEIADAQTQTYTSGSSGSREYKTNCVPLTIASNVIFRKGEIMRCTVEGWSNRASGSGQIGFMHDPANRTVTDAETTQLSFLIPFQLDL